MQPHRFPIGSWASMWQHEWNMDLAERVREWADIGFTLAFSAHVGEDEASRERARLLLDLCADHGIQLILHDARTSVPHGNFDNPAREFKIHEHYRERAAQAVEEFASHPALWAFFLTDEPLVGNLEAVAEASHILRDLTDQAEPYVNLLPLYHLASGDGTNSFIEGCIGFEKPADYLDHVVDRTGARMLSYDAYSSMSEEWGGPPAWYHNLAEYQAAAIRHDIPFWSIILTCGHWMYKAPDPVHMGWQFYNALAYGAQGILHFYYRSPRHLGNYGAPVDFLGNRGPLFHQLQRQHHHFLKSWAWRYRTCKPVQTWHYPTAGPYLKILDGSGIVTQVRKNPATVRYGTPAATLVGGEMIDHQNRPHLLLANGSPEKHGCFRVTVRGKRVLAITDHDKETEIQTWPANDGCVCFQDYIMPGQALFLRVET